MFDHNNNHDVLTDLLAEGMTGQWVVFHNPVTGQLHRMGKVQVSRFNDHDMPEVEDIELPLVSGVGDSLLFDARDVAFCHVTGLPFHKLHTVIDPFCGRTVSLIASGVVEVDGVPFRVCEACGNNIKAKQLRQKIRKMLLEIVLLPFRILYVLLWPK